ncbi:MAG: LysM peptidoglycan-binding domain-containing protein [Ruminococcaceae bacterium]|nr:LysM peptidoglycan-binding domain-containing protein [Oscillospiraceae bacterium]
MDQDFDIELFDDKKDAAAQVQLPVNFLALGEIEPDDVKVYIKQDVYRALERFAVSDTSKELGSILLGGYAVEHGKTHVVISRFIEAKYTDASASTLTFTHETWDYVHSEHAAKHPDKTIVGWQHTHPGYGIFLSNYDLFIQENFFNLPFQVAYVIDPVKKTRGFFQWKSGKIEKLRGFYVYDDVGKPIRFEKPREKKPAKSWGAAGILIALLCAATVGLAAVTAALYGKFSAGLARQEELLAAVTGTQSALAAKEAEIAEQSARIKEQAARIDAQAAQIADLQATLDKMEAQDESAEAEPPVTPTEDAVQFRAYTVKPGDSLTKICAAHGLDFAANARIILAINGIVDANAIFVGQTILLPLTH